MPKKNIPETVTLAKRLVIESLPKCLKLLDLNEIIELLRDSVLSHIFKALKERWDKLQEERKTWLSKIHTKNKYTYDFA